VLEKVVGLQMLDFPVVFTDLVFLEQQQRNAERCSGLLAKLSFEFEIARDIVISLSNECLLHFL